MNCAFGFVAISITLALWMVLVVASSNKSYEYFRGPDNRTVFQNELAEFLCIIEVNSSLFINWYINGTFYAFVTDDGFYRRWSNNSTYNYTFVYDRFYLLAKAEYNNSQIQCKFSSIYVFSLTNSSIAILTIQGPPEAVSDLTVESSGNDLVVTWQAPFTLDVTGVEYDLLYSLLISDVTNETQPVPVACDICHNLTETNFTFSPLQSLERGEWKSHPFSYLETNSTTDLLQEHSFIFTVTPYNGAGRGPPRSTALGDGVNDSERWFSRIASQPTLMLLPTESRKSVIATATVPTQSSDGSLTQGIVLGVSGVFLLLILLSFGVFTLLCYIMIKRLKRKNIATEQNSVYNICVNESLKMNENAAYQTTLMVKDEMHRNIAYETRVSESNMSRNVAYGTIEGNTTNVAHEATLIAAKNHMYETVNNV